MNVVVVFLALAGVLFHAVAAIGLLRLPDVYTRGHALGTADSVGAVLVLTAVGLHHGLTLGTAKLLLVVFFIYVANPAATHAIMRAARRTGVKPWTKK